MAPMLKGNIRSMNMTRDPIWLNWVTGWSMSWVMRVMTLPVPSAMTSGMGACRVELRQSRFRSTLMRRSFMPIR